MSARFRRTRVAAAAEAGAADSHSFLPACSSACSRGSSRVIDAWLGGSCAVQDASVHLKGRDFGARLLRVRGMRVLTIAPYTARTDRYDDLESAARRSKLGMWGACE